MNFHETPLAPWLYQPSWVSGHWDIYCAEGELLCQVPKLLGHVRAKNCATRIAAAPELLASCEILLQMLEEAGGAELFRGTMGETQGVDEAEVLSASAMEAARAAIAKATGENT